MSIRSYPYGEGEFSSNNINVSSARVLSIHILWKDKKLGSCWNGAQSSGLEETARVLLPVREAWLLPTLARTVYDRQHPRILAYLQSLSGTKCDTDAVPHFPFHSGDKWNWLHAWACLVNSWKGVRLSMASTWQALSMLWRKCYFSTASLVRTRNEIFNLSCTDLVYRKNG